MKKWKGREWFVWMVIFAFLSAISAFQIDSYLADKQNLNGMFLTMSIVSGLLSVFGLYKTIRNTN